MVGQNRSVRASELESYFSRTRKGLHFNFSKQCRRDLGAVCLPNLCQISLGSELEMGLLDPSVLLRTRTPERWSPPNGGLTPSVNGVWR